MRWRLLTSTGRAEDTFAWRAFIVISFPRAIILPFCDHLRSDCRKN